ncbi:MAG: thiamine pyrophosphate-binding protein [Chloroflexota bacterium]
MRAADLLIQTLAELGTKHIFSLSGNQIMPIYDAWIDSDINLIHVRHEAAAVHMADAWGRLTGTPGVVLIAGGPGFANGLSAMYVAKMAESPIVVLSGHVGLSLIGKGMFQEMKQAEMAVPVSKQSTLLQDANEIGNAVREAFAVALAGRPGPVHLSLPSDLLEMEVDVAQTAVSPPPSSLPTLDSTEQDTLLKAVQAAKRPLVLAGPAVMRTESYQTAQASLAAANLPLIGMESPRGVHDPSLGAFAQVLRQADLLVLLGKKIDFTLRFGESPFVDFGTQIVQVDADSDVLELTQRNGAGLELLQLTQANPIVALEQVGQAAPQLACDAEWAATVAEAVAFMPPEWRELHSEAGEPLHSAEVGQAIHDYLAGGEDSVLISDGGEFGQWMQAFVKPAQRVINGLSGSIGNAVPFGLAARLAFPESRIVACSGDGAFGFQPFEMETAVRHNIPFTVVIGNDALWNAEYQIQLRTYGPDRVKGVTLNRTNYHQVVEVLGGWGQQVTDVSALENALVAAEESGVPACINTIIRGEAAPKIE